MIGPPGDAGPPAPGGIDRHTGTPPPPPPPPPLPKREGGGGLVPSPLMALEKTLSGPRLTQEPSRNRPRDEQGIIGAAPTKARTIAPNITLMPSRDVVMHEVSNPARERWGDQASHSI